MSGSGDIIPYLVQKVCVKVVKHIETPRKLRNLTQKAVNVNFLQLGA